ncbi:MULTISPECIES: CcdB family protein [Providencia]|uniref:CcdB family protein n=1 Tax=Providencia TaxID=586 RepID=UPI0018E477AB|nr:MULTISPECIES: CcdB family protein [Providencia]EJD6376047.1 CcdB family protein [Providencia rettgeri]EJF7710314.1 CcdB family protein [Providencia rettgeri]ELR5118791.1 CcdB family protein [Providencia rettgeri]MBI6201170.1 CcdB family protein [Providencia rettgeri]MCG5282104.1 CcdB family protein [Providencia rettgeri]
MQYCLYQNREDTVKYPYLLDIQSNIIDILNTRLVIPLFDSRLVKKPLPTRLNPQLFINGQVFVLMTHQMACVPRSLLGKEIVDLSCQRDTIKHAIDLLINGF